jgi:integrase/recombinase XerD
MGGPRFVGVTGPLEVFEAGYAAELSSHGYGPRTVQLQRRLMSDLSLWMQYEGIEPSRLSVGVAERFIAGRRAAGAPQHMTVRSLVPLLEYLGSVGVIDPAEPEPDNDPVQIVLERFACYLRSERGLGEGTIAGYVAAVRPFVAGQVLEDGAVDMSCLTAAEVTGFIVAACPSRPPGPAKVIVTAMRSFLGWLHLVGALPMPLAGAVPSVASRRLAGLPDPLKPGEVRLLLRACDRRCRVGRRDYAMIMLLWRLGLRSGEVAGLGLDDIDWRAGELVVAGKGPKLERLPLPADAGDAVAGWLQRGRPSTAIGRTVFVRVVAPHAALTTTGVTQAVYAVGQRAGLGTVRAHRLRHSSASTMLAAGVTLPDIGQVLRHERILTSAIYAKVDVSVLRKVAAPWPGSAR